MQASLIQTHLDSLAADAQPLDEAAASLLSAQLSPSQHTPPAALPSLSALVQTLSIQPERSSVPPAPEHALPQRLARGTATARECTLWRLCQTHGLHELMTAELIDALAAHWLLRALDRCNAAGIARPTVLECGAGSGALAHFLAQVVQHRATVVAVDDGSSRIERLASCCSVLDQREALRRHAPHIVLAAWMPSGVDWTAEWRACASVREYLLLGASDSSTCGDEWATWGVLSEKLVEEYGLDEGSVPPYEADGFVRAELDAVAAAQLCRFDSSAARGYSTAVAFGRLASLADACGRLWPWPRAAGCSGMSVDAHWSEMRQERRGLAGGKEEARQALLGRLRQHRSTDGGVLVISVPQLTELAEAVAAFDLSLAPAPRAPKQRRAFVEAWWADNEGKVAEGRDTLQFARLALEEVASSTPMHGGKPVADYHIVPPRRNEGGVDGARRYRVHANRTHAFCRVGYRFLLCRGDGWLELRVVESGGASVGEHKGVAVAHAASVAPLATLPDEEGVVWECRLVEML